MGVPAFSWDAFHQVFPSKTFAVIIDGIAGTGLKGPLREGARALIEKVEEIEKIEEIEEIDALKQVLIVSVDLPSGNSDTWEPGMPIVPADLTLAIEPVKAALYKVAARHYGGTIVPVRGIFPKALIDSFEAAELLDWAEVSRRIPGLRADTYKYKRGVVEIWAGSPGSAGAARIAARGAQVAGAGLVRLMVDEPLYPILAASAGGVMVVPAAATVSADKERFRPDALLLGPGWGRDPSRIALLERALAAEAQGTPLILDADAIALAADFSPADFSPADVSSKAAVFHGNAILTPHPGEFANLVGSSPADPLPLLKKLAREKRVCILFKSHVLYAVHWDGRVGVIDGMVPTLATGGSGDLLAGFCVAIAARMKRGTGDFDAYTCALAAAALLIESGRSCGQRFIDPLELADQAASLACSCLGRFF
jgi:NAD(P)H-hydrate epimerase